MSGLVLKLQPGEQILVNGVVMQNGERRAQLRIKTKDANILRLRDALHPDDVDTPVKRVYYNAQLAVAGEVQGADISPILEKDLTILIDIFRDKESLDALVAARNHVRNGQFYSILRELKRVFSVEKALLEAGEKNSVDQKQADQLVEQGKDAPAPQATAFSVSEEREAS